MAQQLLHFFRTPLATVAGRATMFPNNLALYSKDLKLLSLAISVCIKISYFVFGIKP